MTLAELKLADPPAWLAITRTLPLEGGLVNNPADPGGVTDRGVSLRFALAEIKAHPDEIALFDIDHDGDVDWHDVAGLTDDAAAAIYYDCVWKRYGYGRLGPPLVAWKVFDICVNTGPKQAAILLQKAICAIPGRSVGVDGDLGGETVHEVLTLDGAVLLPALRAQQASFYRGLVGQKPALAQFLGHPGPPPTGWLARAAA